MALDKQRVATAIRALEVARIELGRGTSSEFEGEAAPYKDLRNSLSRSLKNDGYSADFINACWRLSTSPTGDVSRHGRVIPAAGMVYLFEGDDPGEFEILKMSDDDGRLSPDPVDRGRVVDGSIVRALEKLLGSHGRYG